MKENKETYVRGLWQSEDLNGDHPNLASIGI